MDIMKNQLLTNKTECGYNFYER